MVLLGLQLYSNGVTIVLHWYYNGVIEDQVVREGRVDLCVLQGNGHGVTE
jgi:hypothetical protein